MNPAITLSLIVDLYTQVQQLSVENERLKSELAAAECERDERA